jgi:hypothetical protein
MVIDDRASGVSSDLLSAMKRTYKMRKIIIYGFCIISLLLWDLRIASSESITFTGKGTALVIAGDEFGAEELAQKAALKKAVSNAMESLIQKGTKDEINFNLKRTKLLKEPYPFVKSKKTLSKSRDGKLLNIRMAIEIDPKKLSRFLEKEGVLAHQTIQRRKADFPSVMVILVEEISGSVNTFPYSSRVIVDALVKRNYDVVDETAIRKSIKHDRAVQGVLRGDAKAALAVALQYGAGMLITGKAVSQKASLKSGAMQPYMANVALQAIQADSGRVIASAAAEGSYPHISSVTGSKRAIEDASRKAVDQLLKDIEKGLEYSEETILTSISGISYAQLAILKKILVRDFETISSIKQKSFAGSVAKLNLKINTSSEAFSESVVLKDFGTFRLDVVSFSPRKIDFVLKMKKTRRQ